MPDDDEADEEAEKEERRRQRARFEDRLRREDDRDDRQFDRQPRRGDRGWSSEEKRAQERRWAWATTKTLLHIAERVLFESLTGMFVCPRSSPRFPRA